MIAFFSLLNQSHNPCLHLNFVLLFVSQRKRKQSPQDEDAVSLCSLDISVSSLLAWDHLSSLNVFVNMLWALGGLPGSSYRGWDLGGNVKKNFFSSYWKKLCGQL